MFDPGLKNQLCRLVLVKLDVYVREVLEFSGDPAPPQTLDEVVSMVHLLQLDDLLGTE